MKTFKNFLYNVAYQLLIMILPLVTAPYIARVLGAELIGVYSYTHSVAYYFVLFAQLGLNVYGNRTIAQVRDDKEKLQYTFFSIYKLQLLISFVTCIAYFAYIFVFTQSEYKLYFCIQFLYVVSSVFDINWFYFGIEKFKLTVTRNTVIKILTVIMILLFVKNKNDLWLYILIMAGSILIGQLALWMQLSRYVSFTRTEWKVSFSHFVPVLILFLPTIATSLYRYMDKIMLGLMVSMHQLGYYENSEKFISISMGVINALGTVMLPKMSNLIFNREFDKAKEFINKSMEGIYIIGVAIAFGLCGVSYILPIVFYGNDFATCGGIIQILAFSILFSAWGNVLRTQFLIPNNRDKEYIVSLFAGAGANLIINCLLIPRMGAIGASIGTVFAEAFVALSYSLYARKELPLIKYIRNAFPYLFLGGGMLWIVKLTVKRVHYNILGLLLSIGVGVIVYSMLVMIYLFVSKGQYYYIIKDALIRKRERLGK